MVMFDNWQDIVLWAGCATGIVLGATGVALLVAVLFGQ